MATLTLLRGLPGSGKSTWAREHVYDLIKSARLRAYKVGRRRYIDADSLARLLR